MSDTEIAANYAQKIEALLQSRLKAQGQTFHERLESVQHHLPDRIIHQAICVALVRDDMVANPDLVIKDRASFEAAANEVISYLTTAQKGPTVPAKKSKRRGGISEFATLLTAGTGALLLFVAVGAAIWTNLAPQQQQSDVKPTISERLPQIGR